MQPERMTVEMYVPRHIWKQQKNFYLLRDPCGSSDGWGWVATGLKSASHMGELGLYISSSSMFRNGGKWDKTIAWKNSLIANRVESKKFVFITLPSEGILSLSWWNWSIICFFTYLNTILRRICPNTVVVS